eukprot:TRINITY_DN54065_c0_g1_i1.p1 TRINITY_DN54065_c0_g1~~TRINITY_DN54065_c0_g1_i1.p1  ORF type:complete len:1170 (+),score=77.75 TRINITY_DN54065_c0_g1_i1:8-3517(+)
MIRKITLLFLAMLFVQLSAYSQKCGHDVIKQRLMATDPAYAASEAAFRAQWASFMATYGNNPQALKALVGSGPDTVFEIPVVVHVLRAGNTGDNVLGERLNPSDAQIQAYIDYTNDAFAANYTGYPTPTTGGTRVPFKFVLAKRDTNCNAVTGINRINASATYSNYATEGIDLDGTGIGVSEVGLKNLSRWRTTVYYNIWIVNRIEGEDGYNSTAAYTAGFAYPPVTTSPQVDGAVILASTVFYRASGVGAWTAGGPGNITLPHELGHALNLKHVFDATGGSGSCPPTTSCSTTGDEICDTQPIASSNFTCPTSSTLTCNGVPNDGVTAHNMMDYSNCQDRFTNGQLLRMMYSFKNLTNRSTYITSLGATAPPSSALPTACTPTTAANSFNLGVYDVIVTTGNNPSPAADTLMHVTSAGYIGDGSRGYIDHTCTHRVTMTAGVAYKMFVNVGPSTPTSRARVFIDYNNDGTFNTTTEQVMALSAAGPGYKNVTFTVPTTGVIYCRPLRMRVIADGGNTGVNLPACGPYNYGQAEDYTAYIVGAGGSTTASVSISNPPIGGNPSCNGTSLKFYAIPSSGITVTGYKWLRNNVIQAGQTTDTFASAIFANNDQVKVRLFFTTPCGTDSVESSVVTVIRATTIAPTVTIGILSGTIPGCIDDTVTFRVTGNVNPGGAPTYQWQQMIPPAVVFSNVAGETGTTYKVWGKPLNTQIRVVMTSSAGSPCAIPSTANSNTFTLTYNQKAPTVSIALTTGTNPGCSGQILAFTATPTTGGTAPTYQWYVNNILQTGVTGATLTGARANGDQVRCVLTSNSPCASPTTANSNTIIISHTQITANVSIAQITPSPSCDGKDVNFSATTVNSGNNPLYQWYKNDTAIGTPTGPNFTLPLVDNDRIKVIFIATDPCVLNPLDTSNEITVTTKPSNRPTLSMKITSGKDPGCLDSVVEFTAAAFNMGINVNYEWYVNGFPAGVGATYSSNAFLTGDIVTVRANQTDGQCYLPDTLYSEPDTMMRSITLDPPIIHLIGNMIVVDRKGSFVWFGPGGQLTGGTSGTYHPTAVGPYYAVTDNMGCWSRPSNTLTITMLDIETVDMKDLGVYPNPTSGLLTLDWKGKNVNVDVTVYSQLGQVVMQEEVKDSSMKVLNLGKLANGTYQIVVKDTDGKKGVIKVQVNR